MAEKVGSIKRLGKDTADTSLVGVATILAWAIPTFTGIEVPDAVLAAAGGVLGMLGARLRD